MKIALFLKKSKIDESESSIPVLVLHADNKVVMEVEKDYFVNKDINYIALWLLTKHIKEVYVTEINPLVKKLFEKLGVKVRRYEDMERNSILRKYLI